MVSRRQFLTCALAAAAGMHFPRSLGATTTTAHKARYWHTQGKAIACELCPNACILGPGATGRCRVRQNTDGQFVTHGYANPCAINVDPVEKKPLYHFFPGTTSYSLAIAGCNFRCKNCQNFTISQKSPLDTEANYLPPKAVATEALKHGCTSVSFTYTEPTVWFEYVVDAARAARKAGLKTIFVSNGFINEAPLAELAGCIDAMRFDLKSFDATIYQKLNEGKLAPVLSTIASAKKKGVWIEIINLVIPEWTDNLSMVRSMCTWIHTTVGPATPLHFSRFFPLYKLAHLTPTPTETLVAAQTIAREENLYYVYIGNVAEIDNATYCPGCNNTLISRNGYRIAIKAIAKGKCTFCGRIIEGVWE